MQFSLAETFFSVFLLKNTWNSQQKLKIYYMTVIAPD